MTVEQIRTSVSKFLLSGNGWPPSLPEFIAGGSEEVDFHAAFMRCLNKEPQGRAEQWVYENAGWNIRTASHEKAERMHKKFLQEAIEKEQRGDLQLNEEMLKALPVNSVKNDNDLAREDYEQRKGKALHPRIAKIIGKSDK